MDAPTSFPRPDLDESPKSKIMAFVLRMTLRELRASWRRLAFFFLCVAVGVGGIVALRSLIQNVRFALAAEARTLTAGDVSVRSDRAWTDDVRAVIEEELAALPGSASTETIDTTTMVHLVDEASTRTKVVELRGVQREFPFYGQFELGEGQGYSFELLADHGALVGPELLTQLGLSVGERFVIGDVVFTVRDVIASEPGRQLGGFSFGPQVLVSRTALEETGLLTFASRANRQILIRVSSEEQVEPLVRRLRENLDAAFVRVGSYRRTENRIERNLGHTENYLSLVGFVVVILGGIGVWSVTRVFVQQRLKNVAILRCLGATGGRVLAIYVLQVMLLALGGSALGVGVAQIGLWAVPDTLIEQAATVSGLGAVSTSLTGSAVFQGLAVGVLVSLLFALVPLLEIRHAKPLLLLRQGAALAASHVDWIRIAVIVAVGVALVIVASWQASSLEIGLYVVGGFTLVASALHLIGRGLIVAIRPLKSTRWFPLRHAVLNLSRPGNQTRVILLAVGLGSFFIIGVQALQTNLLRNFSLELRDDTPDMFLIDVQDDQTDGVREIVQRNAGRVPELIPVLRARVTGVEGRHLTFDGARAARRAGLGREFTVTYRSHLEENERVIDGAFWDDTASPEPEVSIEQDLQDDQGLEVGDRIRFDILGRSIEARVTSVRAVEWDDSRSGGFIFLFRPGALDGVPRSYVSFLRGPSETAARARLQRDISAAYANVSVIDGLEVIRTVRRVLDYVTMAIRVVGGIALFSGGLILVGSVAMTKFQRLYESAIFKTLGANTRLLTLMLVLEYGLLGTLAGAVGSAGALVLTWVLTRQVFEMTWFASPGTNAAAVVVTALVVGVVGVVSSIDVLQRKPLLTLRAE